MKNLQRRWSGLARDKVLSLISLATKAGRCASGEFLTESETKSGRAGLVVVAEDASENTKKKFRDMCEFYDVPIIFYSDKDTLGHAMGKQFRASLAILDEGFAKGILKALKDLGLEENTIVVFSSDHGETMCSQNTNDPKNSPYAESMNVPFLVRYPEKLKPRVEDRLLLSSPDIMPTVLGLAGLSRQIPETVQGTNFAPVISKEKNAPKLPSGVLYLRNLNGEKNADGKIISYFPEARGIKTERYTLAISIDKQHNIKHIFFYDDIKDPYQMNNLSITENQKIFEDLCRQMGQLLKQVNDPWYKDRILSSKIPY